MATAKERGHKDWGFGGVVKRDFKADKSDGEYGTSRDYGKRWYSRGINSTRKNTKRWCRGIKGRKHTLALFNKYSWCTNHKCINCGKEIWSIKNRDDYDYVKKSPMDWDNYR